MRASFLIEGLSAVSHIVSKARVAEMSWLPGQVSENVNCNNVPALILPDQTLREVALA